MQVVEITKALSFNPKVIMLDEPTSALAQNEVQSLFDAVRALRDQGVIVIYITHKLQELPQIADTVTVLRDGRLWVRANERSASLKQIIDMMFGEVKIQSRPKDIQVQDEIVMEVKDLSRAWLVPECEFQAQTGRGIGHRRDAGLGTHGIAARDIRRGPQWIAVRSIVEGKSYKHANPIKMKNAGVGLTPENRKLEGLILIHSILDNLCYASMNLTANGLIENKPKRIQFAQKANQRAGN